MADAGYKVYLFGTLEKRVKYTNKNVKVYATPNRSFWGIINFGYQLIRAIIGNPGRLLVLIKYIGANLNFRYWIYFFKKYLPVINHLPEIFHVQWAKSASEWIFLKELFDVKLVMSLRGAHINYSPLVNHALADNYRKVFPLYDKFHAVSEDIEKKAQAYQAADNKIQVIYSSIDSNKIQGISKSTYELGNPIKVLSVGRFHWKKGYDAALIALSKLKNEGMDVHYTIVAKGQDEKFTYMLKMLYLQNEVTVIPWLSHENVLTLMTEQDMLLVPSFEEGIANVAYEAMAVGLPVISSNCGGMSELIEDGRNGLLFENWHLEALQLTINRMIQMGSSDRRKISERAKKRVRSQFDRNKMIMEFDKFYQSI